MSEIGRLWTGRIFGTNTGNLFVELSQTASGVSGTIRLQDNSFGLAIFEFTGSLDGGTLELAGNPKQAPPGIEIGKFVAKAILTREGVFRGQWETSIGTAGTLELYPYEIESADQRKRPDSAIPEQLRTVRQSVGAVQLYEEDFSELVQAIQKDFAIGRVIVSYKSGGVENTQYLHEFEKLAPNLGKLQYLKVFIQEPEAYGINKLALIELDSQGRNNVMVQGVHESWVVGKAETLTRRLRRYEKNFVTTIKKWGFGLNQAVLIAALVFLLELGSLWTRGIFAAVGVTLWLLIMWAHKRFLPNVLVSMKPRKPGFFARAWPDILSWLIAATAGLAALYAFQLLTRNSP